MNKFDDNFFCPTCHEQWIFCGCFNDSDGIVGVSTTEDDWF
jgi:hypothetical protein